MADAIAAVTTAHSLAKERVIACEKEQIVSIASLHTFTTYVAAARWSGSYSTRGTVDILLFFSSTYTNCRSADRSVNKI